MCKTRPELKVKAKHPKDYNQESLSTWLMSVQDEAQIIWEVFHTLVKNVNIKERRHSGFGQGFSVNQHLQI